MFVPLLITLRIILAMVPLAAFSLHASTVSLFDFEDAKIPSDAEVQGVELELTRGQGVSLGKQALLVNYPNESLFKKVFFETEESWGVEAFDASSLALEITNLSEDSTQLWITLQDASQSVTGHINIAAGSGGTYYIDLDGPIQKLNLGMTGWPPRQAPEVGENAIPFQYAWGARQIDVSTLQHIGLYMKGNLTERTLVIDNIRIVPNDNGDTAVLKGLVNKYGKASRLNWPTKVHSDEDLLAYGEVEGKELAQPRAFEGRSQFGGWADGPRLEATGYFRVEKHDGKWTLIDPEGYLFFAVGIANTRFSNTYTVTGVDYESPQERKDEFIASDLRRELFEWLPAKDDPLADHYSYAGSIHTGALERGQTFSFYTANLERKYGDDYVEKWVDVTLSRMQSWGFTCLGNWIDDRFIGNGRVPYFAHVWIRGNHKRVSTGNDYWGPIHDPFDPEFVESVRESVTAVTDKVKNDPWCIGVFADNEISWGNLYGDLNRFGIVINTLGRPVSESPAKMAFVEILRAKYGSIDSLNDAWQADVGSWESFEDGFSHEGALEGSRLEDFSMLSEDLASQYFKTVRAAVKAEMPNHLYLGARFADWGMTPEAVQAAARHTDIVSYNMYTEGLPGHFEEWLAELDRPSILGEFHFGSIDRGMFHGGICTAANQVERGVKYTNYVRSVLESPYFVGTHWFQYVDSPTTGRAIDGENYNSGFVSVTDTPYPDLINAARELHEELYEIRFGN
ncbi:MAG: beta-galactosidase [Verrucomicrobiota bacterium]